MFDWLLLQDTLTGEATDSMLESILTLGGNLGYAETWLWLTLALLVVEMITSGFVIGAFGFGTLAGALAAWLEVGRNGQLIAFSVVSVLSLVFLRPIFVRWLSPHPTPSNVDLLVGQTGTVIDTVPSGQHGRVRLANEEWRATASENLSIGESVRVTAVSGNTLVVSRA